MTTQQIHCFLEAAKYLSFTEAARHLFITQSSLSKQIAALEHEMGVSLFDRSGRKVTLTSAGVLMRAEFTKYENSLSMAVSHAQQISQAAKGHLSIAVLDLLNPQDFLTEALTRLKETHPDVIIELFFCGFRDLRERLNEKRIDMVFTKKFELSDLPDVYHIDAYSVTPAVAVNADSPLAALETVTVKDIAVQPFIILDPDECSVHEPSLAEMCSLEGVYPRIARYAASNTARLFYVHDGTGVTLVDLEIAVPTWANIKVIPMKSALQSLFSDTSVILAWRKDSGNPLADEFAHIARDMVLRRSGREAHSRRYYADGRITE